MATMMSRDPRLTPRPTWTLWGVLAALAVALPLTAIAAGSNVLAGDVWVSRTVQGIGLPVAADLARLGYWIGATPVTVALAVIVALTLGATRHYGEALLVVAAIATRALNPALKWAVDSPRPSSAWVRISEYPTGLGFPSSHAMGVVILFGAFAYVAQRLIPQRGLRLATQALCLAAILITGFGRIYTGAHWPSDVLGGYLYGACLVAIVVMLYRAVVTPALPSALARARASRARSR